jgi:hypothetical protein
MPRSTYRNQLNHFFKETAMENKYRVEIDPKYHVIIRPALQGMRWSEALAEAINRILLLHSEDSREHWQLNLCHNLLARTSEATYADDLLQYKAELDVAAEAQYDGSISPEAMSDGMWARHCSSHEEAVFEYFGELRRTNGRTDTVPTDTVVVWGLQSTGTGRWIAMADKYGVTSLQIFRTRELAEGFQCEGNRVVWMHTKEWWKKIEDAVKTGYPTQVIVLSDCVDGRTDERIYRIDDIITAGLDEFIADFTF